MKNDGFIKHFASNCFGLSRHDIKSTQWSVIGQSKGQIDQNRADETLVYPMLCSTYDNLPGRICLGESAWRLLSYASSLIYMNTMDLHFVKCLNRAWQ